MFEVLVVNLLPKLRERIGSKQCPLLNRIRACGVVIAAVTCHIGYATFRTVRSERIENHVMHEEPYEVPVGTVRMIRAAKERGGRIIAVGTSTTRVLETLGPVLFNGPVKRFSGETRLFIKPPYRFQIVDALFTNFHMPRTTLLMLASALAGRKRLLAAYKRAIRFAATASAPS